MITPPINVVLNGLAGAAQVRPQDANPTAAQTQIRRAPKPSDAKEKIWPRPFRERDEQRLDDQNAAHQHRLDLSV
jgi:hypothetical protein